MICGTSKAPPGWFCRRPVHEDGPCAALPICGHDNFVYHRPLDVTCPCVGQGGLPCGGILRADGRNRLDTLTFLMCDACGCCYAAEDLNRKVMTDVPQGEDPGHQGEPSDP